MLSCADQEGYIPIREGLAVLSQAEKVYFHNGIKFDYPALRKVYPSWDMDRSRIRDTYTIAAMRFAHIKDDDFKRAAKGQFPKKLAGQHSLKAWGYRLGILKGDFQYGAEGALAQWTPELQAQCEGDTAVTKELVLRIRKAGVSNEAIEIEHALAWYLAAQERNGVPFDMEKAIALQAKLSARREQIAEQMRVEFGPLLKREGAPVVPKRDNKKKGIVAGCEYQKIKIVEFNPGSRPHIAFKLTSLFGWTPTEFTPSGQPELNEKTLKGLNAEIPAVKLLLEYLLVEKRLGQLVEGKEAWMRLATKDGPWGGRITGMYHIHGRVKQNEAITHRAAHAKPNMSAVPKVLGGKDGQVLYGYEGKYGADCRELFFVPDGWVLVGSDASGLELRCLAHYMAKYDGGAYGKTILEGRNEDGTDIHSVNMRALGLEGKTGRDRAKTFIYAFLYGAGDEKLGSILDPSLTPAEMKALGAKKRKEFLKNIPALGRLIADVKHAAKRGWLRTLDGRRVYVRSEHAALNTLLQTAGAIICKRWIANYSVRLEQEFGPQGWDGLWAALLWSHDETQTGCRPHIAERVCQIKVEEIRKITQHYNWRIPLDGEAKVGQNWCMTH